MLLGEERGVARGGGVGGRRKLVSARLFLTHPESNHSVAVLYFLHPVE